MATDAEIRAAGLYAVPNRQYLQNEFQLPIEEEVVEETGGGIPQTQAFTNNVGGGNTFNSNKLPSYRPNYDYRQFTDGYDPTQSATMNMKMNELDPNYKGADYYNAPPSKMEGLLSMVPYLGNFMKGAKFLGNQISPYLPVNRRSIMENELAGQGVMVDDIGRIVQGSGAYNTAANVMAGYSPYNMTAETFDKRINSIQNRKMDQTDASRTRIAAIKEAKTNFLNTQDKTDKIYDFEEEEKKKNKKNTVISRFITKKKENKADKIAQDAKDAQDKLNATNAAAVNSPDNYGAQGLLKSGGYGGNATYSGSGSTVSQSGDVTNKDGSDGGNINDEFAKGGRVGYFYGGRVNYKAGGRVSFKDGGLASIL